MFAQNHVCFNFDILELFGWFNWCKWLVHEHLVINVTIKFTWKNYDKFPMEMMPNEALN